jgi:hypothetical protein
MIADFSGMLPLRDPVLLPDNNAQLANNCWLYRGQVRGFRSATPVYTTKYTDTQLVYRIPTTTNVTPDFTPSGSIWLEYPDPYMTTFRSPVVDDTTNRYYFFPSDQYSSTGGNPAWPVISPGPVYNTFAGLQAGTPPIKLGVPVPTGGPPTVTPPPISETYLAESMSPTTTVVAVPPADNFMQLSSVANILVGMNMVDLTTTTLTVLANQQSAVGTTTLYFSSTGGGYADPNQILVGMTVSNVNNVAAIFSAAQVIGVNATEVVINYDIQETINIGDTIQFQNKNAIQTGTTVLAVLPSASQVQMSAGAAYAGVLNGDEISFNTPVPVTRAYVYTYVTTNSEEGQPSPATVATGDPTGTWKVVIPTPPTADTAGYPLSTYRLYRTVVDSSGNATYYQVAEVPINLTGPVTIDDSALDAGIVGNLILNTIGYAPPPAGLQGVVMMANGIAAGFTNSREVWFSAAYLPYAWPPQYALTVDYPIVGLTANGTSLNILTEGSPFIATGVTPDTMTIGKISANEPCISRGSIVSAGEGAYYASPNGIQLLNTGGTENITLGVYEKEFHYSLQPAQWASGKYGSSYATFVKGAPIPSPDGGGYYGFVMDSAVANVPFTYLRFPIQVTNIYSDELSGQLFALMSNHTVMQWNPPESVPGATTLRGWQWKTKQFRFTAPQEFKAFMVLFEVPPEVTFTLGVRNTAQNQVYNPATQYLIVRVYADYNPVVVREIQKSGEVLLIPGGFKAELWEFQFEGVIGVKFFKCASSVKELRAT